MSSPTELPNADGRIFWTRHNNGPDEYWASSDEAWHAALRMWTADRAMGERSTTVDAWERGPEGEYLLFMNGKDCRPSAEIIRRRRRDGT